MTHTILSPVAALIALTFCVWAYMYVLRLGYIFRNKIPAQAVATPELMTATVPEMVSRPSNNLKNLFELPVIFYVLCLALLFAQLADALFVNLAWAYVALRCVHSAVHCFVNVVVLRFIAYFLSSLVLWAMAFRFASLVL